LSKLRVHDLAGEFGVPTDEVINLLRQMDVPVRSHLSPLSDDQVAQLTPSTQAAYHLLAGDQPDQAAANVAALSPEMHTLLAALSPSSVVQDINAPIYLLHDRSDIFVPFTESRDFNAALDRLGKPHQFVEFSIFQHVEVKSGLGLGPLLGDGLRLYRVVYSLLEPSI